MGGFIRFINSLFINFSLNIIIGKHIKILCVKFHQKPTINEEFDYWGVKGAVLSKVQKLAQLDNVFPNIITGFFCQN